MKPLKPLWLSSVNRLASKPWMQRMSQRFFSSFNTKEEEDEHKTALKTYGKASYDFQYLLNLEKSKLVYKVIRLQRQVDSYITMKNLTNVDGRDKVRVEHPDPEDIIDHFQYNMRRVAFKVVYLGWDYMAYAWAPSQNASMHTNVVERVFMEALVRQQLTRKVGHRLKLDRCGRTDKGVSGLSQVICVNVRSQLDEGYGVWPIASKKSKAMVGEMTEISEVESSDLKHCCFSKVEKFAIDDTSQDSMEIPYIDLLNEALPPDIRVVAWSPVSRYFSPRSSCLERTYRYYFPRGHLDIDLMNEAAQRFVGTKDFRNFSKLSTDNMYSSAVRVLRKFSIEVLQSRTDPTLPECDICVATISASGFIYQQIRLMLSVLYSVAVGYQCPSIIDKLLDVDETKGRPSYSPLAPDSLILYDAEYDEKDISWRWDGEALFAMTDIMGGMWTHSAMRSEILRTIYSSAIEKLDNEPRIEAKQSVINCLHSFDGVENAKNILGLELSKNVKGFQEKSKERAVRKLQRKGKYHQAVKLLESVDERVGWREK